MNDIRWGYQQQISIEEVMADTPLIVGAGRFDSGTLNPPESLSISGLDIVPLFKLNGLTPKSLGNVFITNVPTENIEWVINNVLTTGINDTGDPNWPFRNGSWGFKGWHDDRNESPSWNFTQQYNGNGFDFHGYDIDQITLSMDGNSHNVELNTQDNTYHYNWTWDTTIILYGKAQAPSSPTGVHIVQG